tara:strand:+ start:575 stop:1627 length:1053 start_codon:yes stop_codon:yes gene_type:complete
MRIRLILLTVLFSLLSTSIASAQRRDKLELGSSAPPINAEWVKGEFNLADVEDEVYVVEFWATWCAPCRRSIPHLTRLQEEYGEDGLTIVGISTDKNQDLVNSFVKREGMKMGYTVGIDDKDRTKRAWMDAAGLKGIPAVFIVDRNGIIQYIGNPLSENFDEILGLVMAGRYDLKKQSSAKPSINAAESFRAGNSWAEAQKAYENAIEIDKMVFADLYIELIKMLLVDKNDPTAAYAYIAELISSRGSEDPELLTWIARYIAEDEDIPEQNRQIDVAMAAAKSALSFATRKTDPKYLSTIAFVHFNNNNLDKAIEWQRKSYYSARENKKADEKRILESYKSKQQRADVGE